MKKIILPIVIALSFTTMQVSAQVGVNTTAPAATLDIIAKNATGTGTKPEGLLIPRVDREKAQSMTGVIPSTLIYINSVATGAQTGTAANIDAIGYYYYNGTAWIKLNSATAAGDNIYNANGTLTANRTVTQAGNTLAFTGTAANAFSIDASTFSVDAANHRVGIGTTSPTHRFVISGTNTNSFTSGVQNTTATLRVQDPSYQGLDIGTYGGAAPYGSYISSFKKDDATGLPLIINPVGGNVGIGTVSPQNKLHVNGAIQLTKELNVGGDAATTGSAGTDGQLLASKGPGAAPVWKNVTDIDTNIYANDGTLSTNRTVAMAARTLTFTGTAANAFSVDGSTLSVDAANHRVGIGTTSPTHRFVISGTNTNSFTSGVQNTTATLRVQDPGYQGLDIGTYGGTAPYGSYISSFKKDDATGLPLIINPVGGPVGIGTVSPTSILQVKGLNTSSFSQHDATLKIEDPSYQALDIGTYGGSAPYGSYILSYRKSDGSGLPLLLNPINGNVGIGVINPTERLHVAGNILASGTITPSDIRIKKDIADNHYGLKEISGLRTITYKYKDEKLSKDKKIGFIAQEVKASMPELVVTANDEIKTLGVNYAEMTVVLTKAVQELQTVIQKQQEEINELKLLLKPKP